MSVYKHLLTRYLTAWLLALWLLPLSLVGAASLDTLIIFTPLHNSAPATRFATVDTFADGSTPTLTHLVLDFGDEATNTEFADFIAVMPGQYGTEALEVVISWSSNATSGNVKWDVAWKSVTSDVDDLDTKAFAAIQTFTDATASAAGEVVYAVVDFTQAQADSVAANEMFILRVERDSADAGDTLTAQDAEVHTIEVRFN